MSILAIMMFTMEEVDFLKQEFVLPEGLVVAVQFMIMVC